MINADDVLAVLKANGPYTCSQVAQALKIPPREAREWLDHLKDKGEIQQNWCKGTYSV